MTLSKILLLAAVVLVLGMHQPIAAEKTRRLPVTMATTQQKAKFVTNLVTKSVAMRTIEASGDAEAIKVLNAARALIEEAKGDLAKNDPAAADTKINQVVRMITKTARRLSMAEVTGAQAEKAFASRMESVKAIVGAYDRVVGEKGVAGGENNRLRVKNYIEKAESKKADGDIKGASASLNKAYSLVTKMTRDLREGETLVRELNFKSAKDEYLYEVDRNESHVYLLDMTIKEKKPNPKFKMKIDELKIKAGEYRDQAESEAGSGNHKSAIDLMSESTKQLIKAIRMGGNFIPS